MASSKEQAVSRQVSGSFSRVSSSNRSHSNSLSLSATNNTHRVHRRKSVNASASSTAQAAIAAALRENGDAAGISYPTHRRSIGTKKSSESHSMSARPSMHTYFGPGGAAQSIEHDTFDDMSVDEDTAPHDKSAFKNRNRRASEGSHLLKGASKKGELRCETCGKGYKHSSCLTKHMYAENTTCKLSNGWLLTCCQVQLLEAASVLCNMNAETAAELTGLDATHLDHSEASSASPVYSGSSEMQDDVSSVETTPPMSEEFGVSDSKRYSDSSNGFSRSYRSAASSSFVDSAFSPGLPPQRLSGIDFRPTTSGTDDGSLAAATAGLNFGSTPKTRTSSGNDIPLSRRYLNNTNLTANLPT